MRSLKAVTQPDLKTRGVAYWQAALAAAGHGVPEDRLYRHHGRQAACGRCRHRQEMRRVLPMAACSTSTGGTPPTTSGRSPSCSRRPSTRTRCSSAGPARTGPTRKPLPAPCSPSMPRPARLKWTFDALPPEVARKTGTANVWASMSVDPEHGILYLPVSLAEPEFLRRQPHGKAAAGDLGHRARRRYRQAALEPPDRASRHLGLRHQLAAGAGRYQEGRQDDSGAGAIEQDGHLLRAQPADRRADLSDRGTKPVPQTDVAGEQSSPTQPYAATPEPTVPDRFPGIFELADIASFGECSRTFKQLRYDGRYTPPSLQGSLALSVHGRRRRMGRRRGRSAQRNLCRQQLLRGADLQTAQARRL